jgi:class 3 adenylate cyclase
MTGEKFCGECGAPLVDTAPANAPVASAAKPSDSAIRVKAEQTDDPTPLEGERKTVTALFADIKGSMELMADLDPEEARAVVDTALKLMIDAVHRYDGYIVQSTGDGIFALFGAPVAHEDHPQRALYAGLRMQEELRRYSAKLREGGNLAVEARVGVNTGEVVVRSIRTGETHTEYTPIGHSTSLESRMQALAPTGSIATTAQVRKLCEGYFVFKDLGPTRVKGVAEPVSVYEVTGLGPLRTAEAHQFSGHVSGTFTSVTGDYDFDGADGSTPGSEVLQTGRLGDLGEVTAPYVEDDSPDSTVKCPPGQTGFQVTIFGVIIVERSGDAIFAGTKNAGGECVDFSTGKFTADVTLPITGGSGKFANASGSFTHDVTGQFTVVDATGKHHL